jgi:hypothetical protein
MLPAEDGWIEFFGTQVNLIDMRVLASHLIPFVESKDGVRPQAGLGPGNDGSDGPQQGGETTEVNRSHESFFCNALAMRTVAACPASRLGLVFSRSR